MCRVVVRCDVEVRLDVEFGHIMRFIMSCFPLPKRAGSAGINIGSAVDFGFVRTYSLLLILPGVSQV